MQQRVAAISEKPLVRFFALFHDLGKLATAPELYPKHHAHDDAGFEMADSFCNRLCLPVSFRKALAWVSRFHGKANKWEDLLDYTKIKMAEQAIKASIVEILPMVSAADKSWNILMSGWDKAIKVAGMNTRELGIDFDKLESIPAENRASLIMQLRVKILQTIA